MFLNHRLGSENAGNLGAAAAPAFPVAEPARLDEYRARHPARRQPARTVRNDVDRLRELGYPVDARPGVAGGYRLGAGGALPPLLLDDEEAVAVAVGLRTAASNSIAGIEETSVRALAKLQQVLPARLRHRVSAFQSHALPMPSPGSAGGSRRADRDRGRVPGP